jgi:prevent-host-death family protein
LESVSVEGSFPWVLVVLVVWSMSGAQRIKGMKEIEEVSIRELTRATSQVVQRASSGERMIVTRNGQPIAVILGIDDAVDWLVSSTDEFVRLRIAARKELGTGPCED